jgi:hypothetical protein
LNEAQIWLSNYCSDVDKKKKEMEQLEQKMMKAEEELAKIRESLKGTFHKTGHEVLIQSDKVDVYQIELEKKKLELIPWNDRIHKKRSEINIKQSKLKLLQESATADEDAKGKAEEQVEEINNQLQEKVILGNFKVLFIVRSQKLSD